MYDWCVTIGDCDSNIMLNSNPNKIKKKKKIKNI